ncbi:hypothetical protein ABVT39_006589 [Epinephelus coioides]
MSDSNLDPVPEDFDPDLVTLPETAATPPSCWRKSTRLAQRGGSPSDESKLLLSQLQDHGIIPALGLPLSQLRELAVESACHDQRPLFPLLKGPPLQLGPPLCQLTASLPPSPTPAALFSSRISENALVSTLQSLANSMNNIDARLRALETTGNDWKPLQPPPLQRL